MKKTIRLLSVIAIFAILSISLVSCTILTGKYSAKLDLGIYEATTTYEFGALGSVKRTTVSEPLFGDPETVVTEGKYEILDDPENPEQQIIAFEFEGEERTTASFVQGTEGGVKYIKIGGVQYNVVE
jgi:hypothetical protein